MIARLLFLGFISIFVSQVAVAQKRYGIQIPQGNNRDITCQNFEQAFQNKPKETSFVIKRESNKLFFETNDPKWFKQLFKKAEDGIAVDIVSKDRYACETSVIPSQIKGKLLAPVYAGNLKRGLKPYEDDRYRVEVGTIPISMLKSDLEFNILFLSNNQLCKYYTIYNLESYPWGLLDMGVYLDSITYKNEKIATQKEQSVTRYKTLQFIIPFEKNKSVYDPSDIKPLYDSLRLTDFNIKSIDIKAYASVEGSKERNMQLQQERGKSIAASLQSFQSPEIETNISTSENWVEFFNDLKNTSYSSLSSKSKEQIKAALTGATANELKPILARHRKAIVTMQLDRIDIYKDKTIQELTTLFNSSITGNDLEEARIIQNSLLEKIRLSASPESLEGLEIPNQKKYIDFVNKNLMYDYLINVRKSLIVYNKLLELAKQDPTNKRIQYNLVVLKFILWRNNALSLDVQDFKRDIKSLTSYGINQSLVDRMMINYHIVNAEREMRKRNYREKDRSVLNILSTYNRVPLTDSDYLSLGQFLTYYAQNKEAVKLLAPRAQEITIDEDLLFYYLNLTLVDKRLTQTDSYRTILLNAYNLNPDRFCKLFNPSLEGGVTFQLLEDSYLKKSYCENCTQ